MFEIKRYVEELALWGSGANPFPRRLVKIWKQSRHLLDGGLPYSEGRFEDINKVTCLRLFWNKLATADVITREYAAAEFGAKMADEVAEAIGLLEANYPLNPPDGARAGRALTLLETIDRRLPDHVRSVWRWRLLMLRALVDVELASSPEEVSVRCRSAYDEIMDLYYAATACSSVRPL